MERGGDHARECVVLYGTKSASLGRQPDPPRTIPLARGTGSHWRARLEVPRPNHRLATVVTPRRLGANRSGIALSR